MRDMTWIVLKAPLNSNQPNLCLMKNWVIWWQFAFLKTGYQWGDFPWENFGILEEIATTDLQTQNVGILTF